MPARPLTEVGRRTRRAGGAFLLFGLACGFIGSVGSGSLQAQEPSWQDLDAAKSAADSLYEAGRWEEAEPRYQQALALAEQLYGPVSPAALVVLHKLGTVYHELRRLADESATLERLVENAGEMEGPWSPVIAEYLLGLARSLGYQARWEEGAEAAARGLAIAERNFAPDDLRVGIHLAELAYFRMQVGRYGEAERLYQRAIPIYEQHLEPDDPRIATYLDNLASLYSVLGQRERSESAYRRALEIRTAVFGRSHSRTAITMHNLALVVESEEEADALLLEAVEVGTPDGAVQSLIELGSRYYMRLDFEGAARYYERADSLISSAPVQKPYARARLRSLQGLAHYAQREYEVAEHMLREALDLYASGTDFWFLPIYTTKALAWAVHAQGRLDEAIDLMTRSLSALEDMRPKVSGSDLTLSRVFGGLGGEYDYMVALQLERGDVETALLWSERGRARTLLRQLAAADVDLRSSIPEAERAELEDRERKAAARRAELESRINLVRGRDGLTPEERDQRVAALEDSLRQADDAFIDVYRQIKDASTLYREQVSYSGSVVTLAEASALVPEGGLLLLYQIGEFESHLIAIPPPGVEPRHWSLTVGDGEAEVLGTVVGPLKEATLAAVLGGSGEGGDERGSRLMERTRGGDAGEAARDALHALWRVLVPEELRFGLLGAPEVVIVPDGWLHQLPFEALIVDEQGRDGPTYWLDVGPVVRYAPSITVLHNLEGRSPSTTRDVLTLSDPIFDPAEVPLSGREAGATISSGDVNRTAFERATGTLVRLPGTARETEAILESFAHDDSGGSIVVLQEAEAREPAARSAAAGKRYLHFATHGLVDQSRSDMFASLAVTPPPGASADPADDGFLQLHEIYELPLQDAELAVLSACETNLGAQPLDGEGVFALSRGFLAAGARRVVASQWAVDDASTADIMGAFFETIARQDLSGTVDYARALRDAKRLVRSDPITADPYFWAPFILTGRR